MLKKNSVKHLPACEVPGIVPVLGSLTTFSDATSGRYFHLGLTSPFSHCNYVLYFWCFVTLCPWFPKWKLQALFLRALRGSAPCGRGARSPPPLLSGLCTCRGWRAGRASRSVCWSGLWKAAPGPEKEKNGLFLYHQGSDSSCAILGEVDGTKVLITQLSATRGSSLLTRPSFLRCLCQETFTPLIQPVWQATCWTLSFVLSCLSSLPLIFSITLLRSIIILP